MKGSIAIEMIHKQKYIAESFDLCFGKGWQFFSKNPDHVILALSASLDTAREHATSAAPPP